VALAARSDRSDHIVGVAGVVRVLVGHVAGLRAFAHYSIQLLLVGLEVRWVVVACCCWRCCCSSFGEA
jgi:hypothetical protein